MKYFIDTEFIESGAQSPIELMSIGIVAEDGREFYAEVKFDLSHANGWVRINVVPHLSWAHDARLSLPQLAQLILDFVGADTTPEFWGYFADYDWVVFCQIFGSMIDLPKGWPMYCRDLKQWCDQLGNPELPEQTTTEHHALNDARWNAKVYAFLLEEAKTL